MNSFEELKGKTAIVTGSGRGIGKDIATILAKNGVNITVTDISEETAQQTAEELKQYGVETLAVPCDVSDFSQAEELAKKTFDKWGKIDILVNNAGITMDGLFIRMKPSQWQKVIDINLTGVYNCSFAVVNYMRKARSGNIVNLSSISAGGNAAQANYSSSKAGVIGFTKAIGKELAPMGIRVNAVAPGFVDTPMTEKMADKYKDKILENIPMGRQATAEEIAKVALFLVSDLSSYVTAEVVNVNGGLGGL